MGRGDIRLPRMMRPSALMQGAPLLAPYPGAMRVIRPAYPARMVYPRTFSKSNHRTLVHADCGGPTMAGSVDEPQCPNLVWTDLEITQGHRHRQRRPRAGLRPGPLMPAYTGQCTSDEVWTGAGDAYGTRRLVKMAL
jgi:hypothetical protein